ncbi:multidrug efflux MFS transporter [Clostridium sp. BL-8]|uniref:multidrug efflux MFS transporter n=1 Tax=Clostridium sp. BL-8 TaxID=349938 RepID=UPI00098C4B4F|nr:multidrug efflux MFS transporter [Clostridium sp. BL-8]OOM74612.1 tetracycline resistance protein, class B [Clostridium sp. BL-8]
MYNWKRNLIFCWFGMFVTMVGISQIAPVLPLYIKGLGVTDTTLIEKFSGIAFGATFIVSAVFSPIWGKLADKVGRKPMLLRASLGMAIVIFCMGYVTHVYELIALRFLQGIISGYGTACTTLIATQTDKENAGFALGTLSTASIAGSLLGPLIGGYLDDTLGMRSVFIITSFLLIIAFVTTLLYVKEDFTASNKRVLNMKEVWSMLPNASLVLIMFLTAFILQLAFYSIEPIITVYVYQLSDSMSHLALISGLAFSASGIANILVAPKLGKISDEIGPQKVMFVALIVAGVVFIPQAFVKTPWELMGLRFILGLAAGGLLPSVNILVKKIVPQEITGRVFGLSISAQYLGTFLGSVLGGQIAADFGIRYVFFVTSSLLFINGFIVYKKVYGQNILKLSHA